MGGMSANKTIYTSRIGKAGTARGLQPEVPTAQSLTRQPRKTGSPGGRYKCGRTASGEAKNGQLEHASECLLLIAFEPLPDGGLAVRTVLQPARRSSGPPATGENEQCHA